MHLELVLVEHPEPPRESLHPHRRARLGHQRVEQGVRRLDVALRLRRRLRAELLGDAPEGPLEVRRELPGVVTAGTPCDAVSFEQHHDAVGRAENEERGRDPRDAGADDDDIRGAVGP